jgi:Protein of unknown function (DUF2637)
MQPLPHPAGNGTRPVTPDRRPDTSVRPAACICWRGVPAGPSHPPAGGGRGRGDRPVLICRLSHLAVRLGVQAGYSWWQAAAVPVVADGPAIYGMFRIVSRSRRGAKGAGYGWLLVGCGTLASIGGNVAHAHPDLVAQAIAAAIPLAVLAMLEGLKGDAGEVARLTGQAAGGDGPVELRQADQRSHAAAIRRNGSTATPATGARAVGAQQALPAGPAEPTAEGTVGARLRAAYAQPRPDGQAWTARTLAEAAGCGRSSAASFLQRQRPSTAEDAR